MTDMQREALKRLCDRYGVTFDEAHYWPTFDLPTGYVAGWIGGPDGMARPTLYVGCDENGAISS